MTGAGSPRRPIRRLDPAVVERIAAGEVVERPASVVKELVENAVDAGATAISIRLENGGLDRIEVSDDGIGIPPSEIELAVERHATSKLEPTGPIEEIGSLGFRGEALAAIATVARLRLLSRTPDRDHGEGVAVTGGVTESRFAASRSVGTTVDVRALFFNTPARRKFLKSPASEQIEVVQTVERLYLARPSVGLRVVSEDKEIARYPPTSDLTDAAARVLGPELLHGSFSVEGAVPGGRLRGVLGRPSFAATSSRRLYLAVNGRAIDSRTIVQAVRVAFGEYLPRARYPTGVLHLEIAPERIDVNVHPTKREVRLLRERDVTDAVRSAVRGSLLAVPQVAELPAHVGPPPFAVRSEEDLVRVAEPPATARLSKATQHVLGDAPAGAVAREVRATAGHPRLTLLGCFDALYWVASAEDGLLLIDQHAASERLLYEALRRNGVLVRQGLVEPLVLRLTGAQRETLAAHATDVRAAGFEIEPFGPEVYRVRSVPAYRGRRARAEAITELLDELVEGGRPTIPDGLAERTAATIACHAAIRAGDSVPEEEFAQVLEALYALPEAAYSCPHGRPIVLTIPRGRLDRWFLRTGA